MALGDLKGDPAGEFPIPADRYLVHLIYQLVIRRQVILEEALEAIDLNGSKWRVLYAVWRLVGCTMSELARITGIDRTTLTRAVDRLVEDGLVARSGSPTDRRQVILTLTLEGVDAFHRAQEVQAGTTQPLTDGISEAEVRALCRVVMTMIGNTLGDPDLTRDVLELNIGARDAAISERTTTLD